MKKVISLVLVLVMTAALFCTPAFAATYTSKSSVQDTKAEPQVIFWDGQYIYDESDDLENRKIIAYSDADVKAALENALAEIAAKKEAGKATKADEERAAFLADVKAESLKPLFVKHFQWNDGRPDPISFTLKFEGTEESKLIMMCRDWNDLTKTADAEHNTYWNLVDASNGPEVGANGVHRGTVAVFVVAE